MSESQASVLLVDDEPGVLAALSDCCTVMGLVARSCSGAAEARTLLAEGSFDVAVVDHHLGSDLSGLDLLIEIADLQPDCCRILFSADTDHDLLIDAINRGHVDAFLPKPFRRDSCLGMLRRGVETASLRRHNRELLAELEQRNALLERAADDLSQSVSERTAQIEEVSRRLQEKHSELVRLETQGYMTHLARGLAHELNNPLAAILGYAQRLQRKLSADEDANRRLEVIVTEVDRCRTLVDQIRRLGAPLEEDLSACDPGVLLRAASHRLAESGLVMPEIQSNADLPPVQAGPRALELVFEQVLLNAAQSGAKHVHLATTVANGRSQLLIDNDGVTPSVDDIANAARPFYTSRSTTGGRGLGLAIAAGLLREQDGTICLDRQSDRDGARVIIGLPLAIGSGRYHRLRLPNTTAQVLVVDDEPLIAELLADCLTEAGCEVRTAASAVQGWEVIERQTLRAIVADVHLTDGNGIDLLRRACAAHPHLVGHVALVTGDSESRELRRRADESGFPLLTKPFRLEDMTRFLARLL